MGFVPLSFYTNFLVSRAEECGLAQGKVCGGDNRGLEAFLFHRAVDRAVDRVIDGCFTCICPFCRSIGRIRASKGLDATFLFCCKLFICNDLIFPMRVFESI